MGAVLDSLAGLSRGQRLLAMAIGTVIERVQQLPKEERNALFELLLDLRDAECEEDLAAAEEAVLEILKEEEVQVHELDLSGGNPSEDFDKWKRFVSGEIRRFRTEAKLTQEQLAEKTGLPQSHISRIENGKHSPSHVTLEKIASALKIDVTKLDPNL